MDVAGIAEVATDSRILLPLLTPGGCRFVLCRSDVRCRSTTTESTCCTFSKDDDAAQSKYLLAFNQLTEMQIDEYAKLTAPSEASRAAEILPVETFRQYQNLKRGRKK